MAVLNFRLATLPGIAKVMSVGKPESSLTGAEQYARAAFDAAPSLETSLLLAKILRAQERPGEAIAALSAAMDQPDRFPRDAEMRDAAREFLAELRE